MKFQDYSKYLLLPIIIISVMAVCISITSSPDTITYMDHTFTYQLNDNITSSIRIRVQLIEEKANLLVLKTKYINQPVFLAELQVNQSIFDPLGSPVAHFSSVPDNFSYEIPLNFQSQFQPNVPFVNILIALKYKEGYITYPLNIDYYEQKFIPADLPMVFIKYLFPLLFLMIPLVFDLGRAQSSQVEGSTHLVQWKEIGILTLLTLVMLLFYFPLFYVLTLLLGTLLFLSLYRKLDYIPIANNLVAISLLLNLTPLSLSSSYTSKKIEFLGLTHPLNLVIDSILIIVLIVVMVYNYLKIPKSSRVAKGDLLVVSLGFIIINLLIARLF